MNEVIVDRLHAAAGDLWCRATVHPSFGDQYYRRLEFLGRGALDLAVTDLLYHRFGGDEKKLMRFHDILCDDDMLSEVGRTVGLEAVIKFIPAKIDRLDYQLVAGTVRAVIGAVYQKEGYDAVKSFVQEMLFTDEILDRVEREPDPIFMLKQCFLTGPGQPNVHAFNDDCNGERVYFHTIMLGRRAIQGRGSTRRKAEAKASQRMFECIINPDSPGCLTVRQPSPEAPEE